MKAHEANSTSSTSPPTLQRRRHLRAAAMAGAPRMCPAPADPPRPPAATTAAHHDPLRAPRPAFCAARVVTMAPCGSSLAGTGRSCHGPVRGEHDHSARGDLAHCRSPVRATGHDALSWLADWLPRSYPRRPPSSKIFLFKTNREILVKHF
jgi:hypothetical protein